MRAWSSPDLPDPAGLPPAPSVRIHDTATGALATTDPAGGTARMYVCGITPYDATHLGHAATYVAFDLLNRAWRAAGLDVRYVQNVTDVDDPLLERADATGVDWVELAERETELFRADMAALRVLPPAEYVGAVESIPLVVELVQQLRDRGFVYDVDGDLYFAVHSDPRFGQVSGLDEERMVALFGERGGDPDRPGKKHPLDCLLWQAERPGEPAWDTDLGRGRPGWHVECSAIALTNLGEAFDVQGGGSDLIFPHHEMSASEAQAAFTGLTFAQAYAHVGMVGYDGEKMSKSKGNLVLVSKLREAGVDPMAIRLALLRHHYRGDWEWTDADLSSAEDLLATLREAVAAGAGAPTAPVVEKVHAALASDLDAPTAVTALRDWAWATREGDRSEDGAGDVVRRLADASLGLLL
ncbi:cysteine--1-D-myo-inosityl 2-amino-2-deoxy-alpha-D-glucopyranoside ligase [Nocardioides iriomotensis]|uniref:L-cysteine:1D-myo-inositol 2-amino-2-deoxy-alpha-D-glucopyranoside ligase n=1 Tax=Nocardioides iriomotensis TaxID=715784 RepID=A0A4Q5J278_9ACTN|nr:cysteine--1-D-myo-inosityl 2-amino-2-deoxy-alpha-D-glucopyranoside ligase [Nocardioides iriomotensis]RYU11541.1 cysteine--1-D-myo-inosityl 2-amino-2-deoxy-alpha-D-glucopyranoside ligase [Nocardioides iriomotensis]